MSNHFDWKQKTLEICLFNTEVNTNISRNLWTRFMDIYGYE